MALEKVLYLRNKQKWPSVLYLNIF